jgi:hypothetical protein
MYQFASPTHLGWGKGGDDDSAVLWLLEESCSDRYQGDVIGLQLGQELQDLPRPCCLLPQRNPGPVDRDVEPYAADCCSLQRSTCTL